MHKTHVLAGCGSFMAGLCTIAKELGHQVTAYDHSFQPPMATQLSHSSIACAPMSLEANIAAEDEIVVGNAVSRGEALLERLLTNGHKVTSGAGWLHEHLLQHRKTLAIAGTHGKTTTTALTAWTLEYLGENPGFLLGGIPVNFQSSARVGQSPWFVVEADEYDTAYFDKRPKFFHYPAHALILNNLEFDHADIYPNFEAILTQMRYYLQTLAPNTPVIFPGDCPHTSSLVAEASWCTPMPSYANNRPEHPSWSISKDSDDWSQFTLHTPNQKRFQVQWPLIGKHNATNALHVFMTLAALGKELTRCAEAFSTFKGVARRMQRIEHTAREYMVWDDFAHHPTALNNIVTLLKAREPKRRLVVYLQLCNYTQREGLMWQEILEATRLADLVFLRKVAGNFPYSTFQTQHTAKVVVLDENTLLQEYVQPHLQKDDQIVTCSSRSCQDFHALLTTSHQPA